MNQVAHYPVLTRDEEREAFQRLEAGEESARETLIQCNLRFVVKIALQHRGQGIPLSDLIQEGNLGLLEVLTKFDWRRGFRFSTYAAFWIREAIQRAIRRQSALIRLPVRKARLMGKVAETIRRLRMEGELDPTPDRIGEELGIEPEKIEDILSLRESYLSLDSDPEEDGLPLRETIPSPSQVNPTEELEKQEIRFHVGKVLDYLSEREKEVVQLRFGFRTGGRNLSLRKTSRMVGLSQEGVRRVERRALDKLRRPAIREKVASLI
jgi:RNA polymerase primary sigma factor